MILLGLALLGFYLYQKNAAPAQTYPPTDRYFTPVAQNAALTVPDLASAGSAGPDASANVETHAGLATPTTGAPGPGIRIDIGKLITGLITHNPVAIAQTVQILPAPAPVAAPPAPTFTASTTELGRDFGGSVDVGGAVGAAAGASPGGAFGGEAGAAAGAAAY